MIIITGATHSGLCSNMRITSESLNIHYDDDDDDPELTARFSVVAYSTGMTTTCSSIILMDGLLHLLTWAPMNETKGLL